MVLQTCQEILSKGNFITFCWIPSHRDITGNEDADRAAKEALSKAQPAHFELRCTDVFVKIQPFVSSLWQKRWEAGEAGASYNTCLHIDSLSFDDVIILLTVFEMLLCSVFYVHCKAVFLLCLFFFIKPWFYPVVKYWFDVICFTCFIFVSSVKVSSNISCNDLYKDFIIMYVWYFVSWNSIFV